MSKNVVMMSLWRNDANKQIIKRAQHLLQKSYPNLRYVWLVGDSTDNTNVLLNDVAKQFKRDVDIAVFSTGIMGEDVNTRRIRLSKTANIGFERIRPADDYWMIHESDLLSDSNIVEKLVAHAEDGRCPIAGWPMLDNMFYDIWAYFKDGKNFTNNPPYHKCYNSEKPFMVDGVGSIWLWQAEDIRKGLKCDKLACRDMCAQFKKFGHKIWVDPKIIIRQPRNLWERPKN